VEFGSFNPRMEGGGGGGQELSTDNVKGIVLALLSSGFIGASFIIKKKGLRRAAVASGIRAGVGGYSYLLEPLWWVGMITSKVFLFLSSISVEQMKSNVY
jgi:hypothetical protein